MKKISKRDWRNLNINNFTLVPITKLLDFIVDNRGKSCPTCDDGFPLIATNCIKHSSIYPTFENIRYVSQHTLHTWFRSELKPNDILFVNKGTPGRVCLVPDPVNFCAAQDMIGLRCNPSKVYYKYLFAMLRSDYIQNQISNYHVGIDIPHFKKSDLDTLLIPLCPMDIQTKIGNLYCQLSEKIENNNKINNELESLAKTIYDYWFLQFDFPNEEGKPYKSSGGAMVWNEELNMEIPVGWSTKKLGDIILEKPKSNIQVGQASNKGNIPFFTSGDAILNCEKSITNGRNCFLNTGGVAGLKFYVGDASYSTDTWCIIGKEGLSDYLYLYLLKILPYFDKVYFAGSTLKHLQKPLLKNRYICVPSNSILNQFNRIVQPLFDMISENTRQNQVLLNLRDFLLPLLMNGQVGFKDK